jgi:hypothetical protein
LVAVAADGSREVVSTWQATYAGKAVVRGLTTIPPSALAQLVVEYDDGRPLVTLPLTAPAG